MEDIIIDAIKAGIVRRISVNPTNVRRLKAKGGFLDRVEELHADRSPRISPIAVEPTGKAYGTNTQNLVDIMAEYGYFAKSNPVTDPSKLRLSTGIACNNGVAIMPYGIFNRVRTLVCDRFQDGQYLNPVPTDFTAVEFPLRADIKDITNMGIVVRLFSTRSKFTCCRDFTFTVKNPVTKERAEYYVDVAGMAYRL